MTKREMVREVEEAMSMTLAAQDRVHGLFYEHHLLPELTFALVNRTLTAAANALRDARQRVLSGVATHYEPYSHEKPPPETKPS